jgi:hypothetical protein
MSAGGLGLVEGRWEPQEKKKKNSFWCDGDDPQLSWLVDILFSCDLWGSSSRRGVGVGVVSLASE